MPMLGSHLAITSSVAMLYATLRLTDYSVLVWATKDFESDFPKKQFLMDYLRWKQDVPVLGTALLPTVVLFAMAKFDVFVALVTRTFQVINKTQEFALRHSFDLVDLLVLGYTLVLVNMLGPSAESLTDTCDSIAEFRWNARAVKKTLACEDAANNLRDLYLTLLLLNLTSLALPIMRYRFATPAEKA